MVTIHLPLLVTERRRSHLMRTFSKIAVPLLFILGAALFYKAGGVWWPWQAVGVLCWFAGSVWVFALSDKTAEYRDRQDAGEVLPVRVKSHV